MATRIKTGALQGIDGLAVTVEIDLCRGLPGFHLVGLPNTEVRESRERVLSALRHSGQKIPAGKITVNLAPAGVRKEGASFDLAIAMGIVAAMQPHAEAAGDRAAGDAAGMRRDPLGQALFLGELSLFGELRPVRGLLPIVLAAVGRGEKLVVVPRAQVAEAALAPGVRVIGAADLKEVIGWWRTGRPPCDSRAPGSSPDRAPEASPGSCPGPLGGRPAGGRAPGADPWVQLCALQGQALARKAAVAVAAGRLNLLMIGPPGTGKTRLARILGRLQPDLDTRRALDVTRIHSAAGILPPAGLMVRPPFRAPHHTITRAGLVGGGSTLRPGEVTLAHGGLLFLDELTEFAPAVLEVLREPLELGRVSVVRGSGRRDYPADFQLVAAMNPCRCGYLGSRVRPCRCSPADRARHLGRLSGPLLDRFDVFVEVGPWEGAFLGAEPRVTAHGMDPAAAVPDWRQEPGPAALVTARARLQDPRAPIVLGPQAAAMLDQARVPLGLSLRGVTRCVRVARTLAALDGQGEIACGHVREALEFRREILTQLAQAD